MPSSHVISFVDSSHQIFGRFNSIVLAGRVGIPLRRPYPQVVGGGCGVGGAEGSAASLVSLQHGNSLATWDLEIGKDMLL